MQWDEKELDTQFTPNEYFWTPNSEILAKALPPGDNTVEEKKNTFNMFHKQKKSDDWMKVNRKTTGFGGRLNILENNQNNKAHWCCFILCFDPGYHNWVVHSDRLQRSRDTEALEEHVWAYGCERGHVQLQPDRGLSTRKPPLTPFPIIVRCFNI